MNVLNPLMHIAQKWSDTFYRTVDQQQHVNLIHIHHYSDKPSKDVLKKRCSENMQQTYKRPCRSVISKKLHGNFIEPALRHGCSPVNLMHIFRTTFLKNTAGGVLLNILTASCHCKLATNLIKDLNERETYVLALPNEFMQY